MNSAISIQNVTKSFREKQVLKGVTFDVPVGKIVAPLGSNGSGKSTLIKCMTTLLRDIKVQIYN